MMLRREFLQRSGDLNKNEGTKITRTIETLLEARYLGEKEIIIVDDGSTDDTHFRALPYAKDGYIMLFKREAGGSKALAVDYGLTFAKGDVVVVVDADTQLEVESLKYLTEPFVDERVQAVSGNVCISNTRSLVAKLQALEYLISMEIGKFYQGILGTIMVVPGAFGAFRRKFIVQIGRYDRDTITEDFDVTIKIHKAGQVAFAPKALAWTNCPETWGAWIRQRTRWARGEMETLSKHRNMFLVPLVSLIYRPGYSFVRLRGYLQALLKTEAKW